MDARGGIPLETGNSVGVKSVVKVVPKKAMCEWTGESLSSISIELFLSFLLPFYPPLCPSSLPLPSHFSSPFSLLSPPLSLFPLPSLITAPRKPLGVAKPATSRIQSKPEPKTTTSRAAPASARAGGGGGGGGVSKAELEAKDKEIQKLEDAVSSVMV